MEESYPDERLLEIGVENFKKADPFIKQVYSAPGVPVIYRGYEVDDAAWEAFDEIELCPVSEAHLRELADAIARNIKHYQLIRASRENTANELNRAFD